MIEILHLFITLLPHRAWNFIKPCQMSKITQPNSLWEAIQLLFLLVVSAV